MARRSSRKIKTAAQIEAEAQERMRATLTMAGVPPHRVAGERVRDFAVAEFADIKAHRKERRSVFRLLYPTLVDRWLAEGGSGFDEPQKRACEHLRGLWALLGSQRLVANYSGVGGGSGVAEGEVFARRQLAEYKKDIPSCYWSAAENVIRFDCGAAEAGEHLARTTNQRQAHAKAATGFVLSLVAMWRGY